MFTMHVYYIDIILYVYIHIDLGIKQVYILLHRSGDIVRFLCTDSNNNNNIISYRYQADIQMCLRIVPVNNINYLATQILTFTHYTRLLFSCVIRSFCIFLLFSFYLFTK